MEHYFNILTEDLILIIIHKCRNRRVLGKICKSAYKKYELLLTSGDIKPNLRLYNFEWYTPECYQLEINLENVNINDLDDILYQLLGPPGLIHAYYLDHYWSYQGNFDIVYKTKFNSKLIEILKKNSVDLNLTTECDVYISIDASWQTGSGGMKIIFDRDWKLFWNVKLEKHFKKVVIESCLHYK